MVSTAPATMCSARPKVANPDPDANTRDSVPGAAAVRPPQPSTAECTTNQVVLIARMIRTMVIAMLRMGGT